MEKFIKKLNIPNDMIAPSHGVIWRDNPNQIIDKYAEWSDAYQENQITLVYDSMWHATRKMAEAIAEGIKSVDDKVVVKLYNAALTDKNDVITQLFKSKGFLFGSSTVNKGIMHATGGLLEMIKGIGFKKKKTAAFGSYGWSGESVDIIEEKLKATRVDVMEGGPKALWNPDKEAIDKCVEFGKEFAKQF